MVPTPELIYFLLKMIMTKEKQALYCPSENPALIVLVRTRPYGPPKQAVCGQNEGREGQQHSEPRPREFGRRKANE